MLCGSKEVKASSDIPPVYYNITFNSDNKATYTGVDESGLPNMASEGTEIRFKVFPMEGYEIEKVRPTTLDVNLQKDDNVYWFLMPARDVIIYAQTKLIQSAPEPIPDRDTFKSEEPSGTVLASPTTEANKLGDLKVHATDARSILNQEFLAKTLISSNVDIIVTENVYPRRDLTVTEDGSLRVLTWGNLPKNEAGPTYAVVYNQIDGAYVLNGILDKNGVATFTGFKLRPASTITICK